MYPTKRQLALAICSLVFLGGYCLVPLPAEVVTFRLGTGLSPTQRGGRLPQAWVVRVDAAPKLDGRLDEPPWSATQPVVLGKLESDAETSPRTEARLVHTEEVLYVGVEMAEPDINRLKRTVHQTDGPAYRDDSIELFLSPDPSRGYFQVIVSATGAIFDRRDRDDPGAWDSGARASTAVEARGWSLEVAIPMAALGVGEELPTRWRANIYRNRQAGPEGALQAWSPTFSSDYDVPARFGQLLFTSGPPRAGDKSRTDLPCGIAVEDLGDGGAVLLFDVSAIPRGARVHRARLLCQRGPHDGGSDDSLRDIEIYPLRGPYKKGRAPAHTGQPLALVSPWYRSFEMTEPLRPWVAGRGPPGLYVKVFPGWRKHATYLDVMVEGEPTDVPPPASGVQVFHRAGQTFITWREIDDPVGSDQITWGSLKTILDDLDRIREVRYSVYRHHRPITSDSLHQAELIATVTPLSCWNVNGRNVERGIDWHLQNRYALIHGHWNPFSQATLDGDFGRDGPIDRLVIEDGKPPLSRGTGLYVHTATAAQAKTYYAVLTQVDGVQNTRDLTSASTAGPISEAPGPCLPVLQKEFPPQPHFNYPERRLHFVRWVAPPFGNHPCQYFNWSVGVPKVKLSDPHPLELSLPRDDRSYWRTQYRVERDSIVLTPHDFPTFTWWYGYHEAIGTLRSFRQGTVQPYTERRLLWFVRWVAKRWPVDRDRILVTSVQRAAGGPGRSGRGGGCSGALHLAFRHPDVFHMVLPGQNARVDYAAGPADDMQALWGRPQWALKTDTGQNVWDELNLVRRVEASKASFEWPLVTLLGHKVPPGTSQFIAALLERRQPVMARFNQWPGPKLIPVSASSTWGGFVRRLDVRRNRPLPTFSHSRAAAFRDGSVTFVDLNLNYRWTDVVDRPDRIELTLSRSQHRAAPVNSITLRRAEHFKPRPGQACAWTLGEQSGDTAVDADGLVTIPQVSIPIEPARLVVTIKKQASGRPDR